MPAAVKVVLTDVGLHSPYAPSGGTRLNVNNLPILRTEDEPFVSGTNRRMTYFPVGMKNLFKSGCVINSYGDRQYDTEADARADISQAVVRFGRQLVGLEPGAPEYAQALEAIS